MASLDSTLKAIHLGCSANVFTMTNGRRFQLIPSMKALPSVVDNALAPSSIATLIAAAKRLGYCFATTELPVICAALRVRF
jgi:hypothetical protein